MDKITSEDQDFSIHRCPVCKGRGKVNYDKQVCGSCCGKGYIVLDNKTGRPVSTVEEEIEGAESIYGEKTTT